MLAAHPPSLWPQGHAQIGGFFFFRRNGVRQAPPLSYPDQAALLIERGLVVSDPNVLMRQLEAVGYYRLCAYWYPFKQADSSFVPGTSFDVVWNRYVFDRQLRLAVMDAIERVEIAIRTALVTELAMRHGAFAHVDPKKLPSAHHARLWNRELAIRATVPDVKNGPEWHRPQSIDTNRMFVVLTILRFLSKNKMATLLKTSRTQVDRLLDPKNDITLGSLQRAAAMVGRRVNVELV